jgi:hypothetical protein
MKNLLIGIGLLTSLFLAACAEPATPISTLPAPQIAIRTATSTSTFTASPTALPTQTFTPTITPTSTGTSTATLTSTPIPPTSTRRAVNTVVPTESPTPAPAILQAGNYPQPYNCVHYSVHQQIYDLNVEWCIPTVKIEDNGNITFTSTWTADNRGETKGLWLMSPDAYNKNMFVVDNLGQRYDHIATDGTARDGASFNRNQLETHTGWYTFPPPQPGAFKFIFVDLDQNLSIVDIILTSPLPS